MPFFSPLAGQPKNTANIVNAIFNFVYDIMEVYAPRGGDMFFLDAGRRKWYTVRVEMRCPLRGRIESTRDPVFEERSDEETHCCFGGRPLKALRFLPLLLVAALMLCAPAPCFAEEAGGVSIALLGPAPLSWPCGVPFEEPGFQVWDQDSLIPDAVPELEGEVTVWRTGTYTLRYRYGDAEAERTVTVVPQMLPETVRPPAGTICLSFDDGPCEDTGEVLDILAKYGVKACFFIVGNQTKYLDILPRIVAEGHTLGIHCYDHRSYGILYRDEEHYFSDLMKAQEVIHVYTGEYAHVLRFPGGSRTASFLAGTLRGGYQELYAILADMGIREYDWTVQPESAEKTTEGTLIAFSHPRERYDYAVVLQHDVRRFSVKALERMIQWAQAEGYSFARLDETCPEVHFVE